MSDPKRVTVPTNWIKIYAAGDIEVAKQICRKACFEEGLCVTIEPCVYIYTGGEEQGYCVGLINYPRFPSTDFYLMCRAERLAKELLEGTFQDSILIMDPKNTTWITRRQH